jgi:SAM-dependent methyltransferase
VSNQDRSRSQLFGRDASRYDRARPSYPAALIDDLVSNKPSRVLDVGCGTGKAARLFAARGCQVLGIEPDERMAAVARSYGTQVEIATFEAWDAEGRTFELIVSGQPWHWVDRDVSTQKAGALLPAGGVLAMFWNRGTHDVKTHAALNEAYKLHAPALESGYVPLGHLNNTNAEDVAAIVATGSFAAPELRSYEWVGQYTRDEWVDQLGTHSDHLALPAEQLESLMGAVAQVVDQLGGTVTVHYRTDLILARKK